MQPAILAGRARWTRLDADGGLEHGDEWEAKIRRQIKECVLLFADHAFALQPAEAEALRAEAKARVETQKK